MAELAYQISTAQRKKRTLRIPESHTLYLCPNSCARRQGIRALKNGLGDNTSFLRFSQADVASGDYERCAIEAVGRLLGELPKPPRVISLYVNCIDEFLGTDASALVEELSVLFPDVRFLLSRINPISADVRESKAQRIQTRLYDPLVRANRRDDGITLLGNFEPIPANCEFHEIARKLGFGEIRQLFSCETYEEYERLAESGLAISLSHLGDAALENFEERLGVPGMLWPATYSVKHVRENYQQLASFQGSSVSCSPFEESALGEIERARLAVGSLPLALDSSASMRPFSLALDLLSYGFNVTKVFALHVKGNDKQAEKELMRTHSEVSVITRGSYEAIEGYDDAEPCLAIGVDAAFLLKAPYVVDMYHDEGHFGFQGIELLMRKMRLAVECRESCDVRAGAW